MSGDSIEKRYERAFEQTVSLQPVFPEAAKREMARMVEVMARAEENINYRLNTNQNFGQKGGFIAEEVHAETFNLDAVLKDSGSRAITDRYKAEWHEQGLKGNDNPDIVIMKDGEIASRVQSKYEQTYKRTAGKLAQRNPDGSVKYETNDQYLVPDDQRADIREYARQRSQEKANEGDSSLAESFRQTSKKSSSTIKDGEVESRPLSKEDADSFGKAKNKSELEKLNQIEAEYQTKSTIKQMRNAAVGAAAMSAVVSGTVNTLKYIQLAKDGAITAEEATVKIISETVASAVDSAVKASANAGVQSLMVRYGSKEAAMQVLAQQGMKNMLKTNAVTVGVVCAVDAVKDLVRLGTGQISRQEFFDRQGKGVLMTSAGVAGGAVGTAAGVGVATALGASSGSLALAAASFIGGLSGGMIAGLAMTLAIENGIEKPFRDLVRNTQSLQAAATELERASQTIFRGQLLFTKYLQGDFELDAALHDQLARIDRSGARALDIINQI